MRANQKEEAEKKAKLIFWLTIARIVAEVQIVVGFLFFVYFLVY